MIIDYNNSSYSINYITSSNLFPSSKIINTIIELHDMESIEDIFNTSSVKEYIFVA